MPDRRYLALIALTIIVPVFVWLSLGSFRYALILGVSLALCLAYIVSRFRWQPYLFSAIALMLPLSIEISLGASLKMFMPTEPLIMVALLCMIMDIIRIKGFFAMAFSKPTRWVWMMLVVIPITIVFSSMPMVSFKFAIVALSYILVFFIYLRVWLTEDRNLLKGLMSLYSISLAMVVVYGAFRYVEFGYNPATIKGVFDPFYSDHTILGAAVALVGVYWAMMSLKSTEIRSSLFHAVIAIFFICAVVFSSSRAALISVPFAVITAILLWMRVKLPWIMMMTILVSLIIYTNRFKVVDELLHNRSDSGKTEAGFVEQAKSVGNVTTDVSNIERLNRWVAGVRMFVKKPVTGFGPGTYQFQYIPYQEERFMNRLTVSDPWHIPENSGGSAHSEYILVLSEMGLLGIIALMVFWGGVVIKGFRGSWSGSAIPFVAVSTFLVHALFNNFLTTDKFAFLFYSMIAMLFLPVIKNGKE